MMLHKFKVGNVYWEKLELCKEGKADTINLKDFLNRYKERIVLEVGGRGYRVYGVRKVRKKHSLLGWVISNEVELLSLDGIQHEIMWLSSLEYQLIKGDALIKDRTGIV